MPVIDLIPITRGNDTNAASATTVVQQACVATRTLYDVAGFVPPWIGYLARSDDQLVGTCTFKAPPSDGKVEIGYFTFPANEGQGIATAMVAQLLDIVQRTQPALTVVAQTVNRDNASNAILRKFGFRLIGNIVHPEDGVMWEWQRSSNS